MAPPVWNCSSCGERSSSSRRFCTGCGAALDVLRPGLSRAVQTQFALPDYLRGSATRSVAGMQAAEESAGGGFILVGAIAIAGVMLFTSFTGVGAALFGLGVLSVLVGLWRLRHDGPAMERIGWLAATTGAVVLAGVVYQLVGPAAVVRESAAPPAESVAEGVSVATGPSAIAAGSMPMWRGNAAQTGVQPGPGPSGRPATAWRTFLGGEVYSSPVVADGRLFIGTKSGFLVAFDAATGEERWRADLGGYITRSTPVVADGTVYAASGYAAFAFDVATGRERWRAPIRFAGSASPVVADGMLYVPTQEGNLFAFDVGSGEELWQRRTEGLVFGSAAVADGLVVYGDEGGTVYALDAETGREEWRVEIGGEVAGAPALADGIAYVSTAAPALVALDAAKGTERWRLDIGGAAPPAVRGDLLVLGADDQGLYGVDAGSGSLRWLFPTGGAMRAAPAIADATIYAASGRSLYAVDAATGEPRWSFPTGGTIVSSPAVVGGRVFVGSHDGFLYALTGDRPAVTGGGESATTGTRG